MTDSILNARLAALEQNLKRAAEGPSWWDSVQELKLPSAIAIWEGLNRAIMDQAREHLETLQEIRDMLKYAEQTDDVKEAWRRYAEVYKQCQEFFGECLEVIGGLTFRYSGLEERIYQLADDLISDCVKDSTSILQWVAPTVPALPETLIKTLARMIGLRFPEWTIWTLPFTAHELGHVVIREDEKLCGFPRRHAEAWANGSTIERAKSHLNEYLADAFATYTMGPAYACAVILLRFNPLDAYRDDDEHPADAKRAHVVLTMLQRMNDAAGMEEPYEGVKVRLSENWQEVLRRAGQPDAQQALDAQRLEKLVDGIWPEFEHWLRPAAKYPHDEKAYGWLVAEEWYRTWKDQLEKGQLLNIQDVSPRNTLRDVLNAAWLCRLEYLDEPEHLDRTERIEEAAHKLCAAIIAERRKASGVRGAGRGATFKYGGKYAKRG